MIRFIKTLKKESTDLNNMKTKRPRSKRDLEEGGLD